MATWRKCIRSRVQSVTMANASHVLNVEYPEEFTQILKKFLVEP